MVLAAPGIQTSSFVLLDEPVQHAEGRVVRNIEMKQQPHLRFVPLRDWSMGFWSSSQLSSSAALTLVLDSDLQVACSNLEEAHFRVHAAWAPKHLRSKPEPCMRHNDSACLLFCIVAVFPADARVPSGSRMARESASTAAPAQPARLNTCSS